jgi:hypothetical protein
LSDGGKGVLKGGRKIKIGTMVVVGQERVGERPKVECPAALLLVRPATVDIGEKGTLKGIEVAEDRASQMG